MGSRADQHFFSPLRATHPSHRQAPFVGLVTLGSYALATIGFKLSRFNDCEVAAKELTEVRLPQRCVREGVAAGPACTARELPRELSPSHPPVSRRLRLSARSSRPRDGRHEMNGRQVCSFGGAPKSAVALEGWLSSGPTVPILCVRAQLRRGRIIEALWLMRSLRDNHATGAGLDCLERALMSVLGGSLTGKGGGQWVGGLEGSVSVSFVPSLKVSERYTTAAR